MDHQLDHDACCIHCGLDACDYPRGERLPYCPVWLPEVRRANFLRFEQNTEQLLNDLWDRDYNLTPRR